MQVALSCEVGTVALPWLGRLLAGFLPQRSGFNPRLLYVSLGPIDCPKTSVNNYQSALRNVLEERRPHLQHRGGSLKSLVLRLFPILIIPPKLQARISYTYHRRNMGLITSLQSKTQLLEFTAQFNCPFVELIKCHKLHSYIQYSV